MKRLNLLLALFIAFFALQGRPVPAGPSLEKPFRILVTNDDGIDGEGIRHLARELEKIAEVTVVAPLENSSGGGHSITTKGPIMVKEVSREGRFFGYALNCTPASCVKAAIGAILRDKPDLVVSGINSGYNLGRIVYVSGTFGAAQEAIFYGIPAIAVSLQKGKKMDFAMAADFTREFVLHLRKTGFAEGIIYNVNVPCCTREELKGCLITDLTDYAYKDYFTRKKTPWGQTYLWGEPRKVEVPDSGKSDVAAVYGDYISITPVPLIQVRKSDMQELGRHDFSFEGKPMR